VPAARVEIGVVARAHAIHGEVAIVTHDPDDNSLANAKTCWIDGVERAIASVRDTHRGWLVALDGVTTRDAAEALRGRPGEIERAQLELADDDVLLADLVGCAVVLPDGRAWGTIAAIDAGPEQDRLVIHDGGVERLLPIVDAFVVAIDLDARTVTVDPPDGLPETAIES
jgi:16S rRNA processing protein RimM